MANLKNIIDELKTVAEAFTSLASTQSKRFKYDRLSYINGGNNEYPMIYVDSAITKDNVRLNKSFLPSLKTYTISVYLFDTYHQQEKQSKSIQQKQGELEDLFEQYLAEVKSRLLTSEVDVSNLPPLKVSWSGTKVPGVVPRFASERIMSSPSSICVFPL